MKPYEFLSKEPGQKMLIEALKLVGTKEITYNIGYWHVGIIDMPITYVDLKGNNRHVKAKAMKVSIKTIKQAAIISKSQT